MGERCREKGEEEGEESQIQPVFAYKNNSL